VAATGNWHADLLEVLRSLVFDKDPTKCSRKSLSSYIHKVSPIAVHYDGLASVTSLCIINSLAGNGQSERKTFRCGQKVTFRSKGIMLSIEFGFKFGCNSRKYKLQSPSWRWTMPPPRRHLITFPYFIVRSVNRNVVGKSSCNSCLSTTDIRSDFVGYLCDYHVLRKLFSGRTLVHDLECRKLSVVQCNIFFNRWDFCSGWLFAQIMGSAMDGLMSAFPSAR